VAKDIDAVRIIYCCVVISNHTKYSYLIIVSVLLLIIYYFGLRHGTGEVRQMLHWEIIKMQFVI